MESTDIFTIYNVGTEEEFRFSVGEETSVQLELVNGHAEILGYELFQHKVYTFTPYTSVSVFSWKGCQIKLWGVAENVCCSANNLIMMHVNMHARLEEMRILAHSRNKKGPICLVVGPEQSGKTSFCKLLLNYAVRLKWSPMYVDLNVIHNTFSFPGVFSVLPVENQLDMTNGQNPQGLSMFNFGFPNPRQNGILYYLLIKTLGKTVLARLESEHSTIRSSGVIIDTCSVTKKKDYDALTLAAYAFEVDVVFVVRDRSLFSRFQNDMPSSVRVVYIPNQDGVTQMDRPLRLDVKANRITSVKGVICILKVDKERKVLTVLSPQPAPLPNRILILTLGKMKRHYLRKSGFEKL